jgi:hypothetical protein
VRSASSLKLSAKDAPYLLGYRHVLDALKHTASLPIFTRHKYEPLLNTKYRPLLRYLPPWSTYYTLLCAFSQPPEPLILNNTNEPNLAVQLRALPLDLRQWMMRVVFTCLDWLDARDFADDCEAYMMHWRQAKKNAEATTSSCTIS